MGWGVLRACRVLWNQPAQASQAPGGAASQRAPPDFGQNRPFRVIWAANEIFFSKISHTRGNLLTSSGRTLQDWLVQVAHLSAPLPTTSVRPLTRSTMAAELPGTVLDETLSRGRVKTVSSRGPFPVERDALPGPLSLRDLSYVSLQCLPRCLFLK